MDDGFSAPESYVAFGTFAGFDPPLAVFGEQGDFAAPAIITPERRLIVAGRT